MSFRSYRSPIEELLSQPQRFEFHQAVRLLRRWFKAEQARNTRQQGVELPRLQYRNTLSLAFPASEIARLDASLRARHPIPAGLSTDASPDIRATAYERIAITPAFMGLLGVGGALPLTYTELFAQKSDATRAFLDIFQHRAVSLFHEGWRKHRLPLQFEEDRRIHFRPLALSLAGFGLTGLTNRLNLQGDEVSDDALAYYASIFQQRVVGAAQLQNILADYFGIPVRVEQFVGQWFALEPAQCTRLGEQNAVLGQSALVGERVWQRDLRVRIVIGPMNAAQHSRFVPGGAGARALKSLLTLVSGLSLEYEIKLRIKAEALAPTRLADDSSQNLPPRLGWSTFLMSKPAEQDREESVFVLHGISDQTSL